jgi:AAHS family cis,cis-muconate transporter-like MFS transporter
MNRKSVFVITVVTLAMIADGIDLQVLALVFPILMKDLEISPVLAGMLGTYTLIGMGMGGISAGWAADRIGRVRVIWWSILIFSLCTGIIGLCDRYWQIAVMRILSGLGLAAVYSVGNLLAAEYVPTKIRNTVLNIIMAGWSVGYVVAAIASSAVLPTWGWRPLFFLAAMPGLACLIMMYGISDPPGWPAARKSAKYERKNEFTIIWKNRSLRKTFIMWSTASVFLQFGYYGANTWLPSYLVKDLGINLKNMGWFLAASYAMGIFSKPVIGALADRFGRRLMWVVTGLCITVAIPAILFLATRSNVAFLLLIFGGFYGALYAINATYLDESFPTTVRGTAMATSYNVGRIGSIISPVFIGWVASGSSVGAGIATCAGAYLITTLVPGIFIREKMYDPMEVKE